MRADRGFTLIEVVVALVLGATIVLVAHRLCAALLDWAAHLTATTERLDREANGRRVLVAAVESIDISSAGTEGFAGGPSGVRFSSWAVDVHGWPALRSLTLGIQGRALVLDGLDCGPVAVADSVDFVTIDYLLELGEDARWMRSWSSALSVPVALRVRIEAAARSDTLLLAIGPRG